MVKFDRDLAGRPEGRARGGELVIGLIALICTVIAYDGNAPGQDVLDVFYYSVIVVWAIIAILCFLAFLGIEIELLAKLDVLFHACACILLIVASCFFLATICKDKCGGETNENLKITGGVFGILFGIFCGAQVGFIF